MTSCAASRGRWPTLTTADRPGAGRLAAAMQDGEKKRMHCVPQARVHTTSALRCLFRASRAPLTRSALTNTPTHRSDGAWTSCSLSGEPLRAEEVVACARGRLYNRSAVLEHLLALRGLYAEERVAYQARAGRAALPLTVLRRSSVSAARQPVERGRCRCVGAPAQHTRRLQRPADEQLHGTRRSGSRGRSTAAA